MSFPNPKFHFSPNPTRGHATATLPIDPAVAPPVATGEVTGEALAWWRRWPHRTVNSSTSPAGSGPPQRAGASDARSLDVRYSWAMRSMA